MPGEGLCPPIVPLSSVSEQYNLLAVSVRWCSVAGKITAGLTAVTVEFMTPS